MEVLNMRQNTAVENQQIRASLLVLPMIRIDEEGVMEREELDISKALGALATAAIERNWAGVEYRQGEILAAFDALREERDNLKHAKRFLMEEFESQCETSQRFRQARDGAKESLEFWLDHGQKLRNSAFALGEAMGEEMEQGDKSLEVMGEKAISRLALADALAKSVRECEQDRLNAESSGLETGWEHPATHTSWRKVVVREAAYRKGE